MAPALGSEAISAFHHWHIQSPQNVDSIMATSRDIANIVRLRDKPIYGGGTTGTADRIVQL